MKIGTLDELIAELEDARETLGGEAPVRVACQPGWPKRATIVAVTIPDPDREDEPGEAARGRGDEIDGLACWLAVDDVDGYHESPYAPQWAWAGDQG